MAGFYNYLQSYIIVIIMFFAAAFVGQTIGWLVVWSANKGPFHRLQ